MKTNEKKAIRSCAFFAVFFALLIFVLDGPWYYWIVVIGNAIAVILIFVISMIRKRKDGGE